MFFGSVLPTAANSSLKHRQLTLNAHHRLIEICVLDIKEITLESKCRPKLIVFSIRLRGRDLCSTPMDTKKWILEVNTLAALQSAPPLPAAAGSTKGRFMRPVLPESKSRASEADQLTHFSKRLVQLQGQLDSFHRDLEEMPPSTAADQRYLDEKLSYLEFEIRRYQRYIDLLEARAQQQRHKITKASSLNYPTRSSMRFHSDSFTSPTPQRSHPNLQFSILESSLTDIPPAYVNESSTETDDSTLEFVIGTPTKPLRESSTDSPLANSKTLSHKRPSTSSLEVTAGPTTSIRSSSFSKLTNAVTSLLSSSTSASKVTQSPQRQLEEAPSSDPVGIGFRSRVGSVGQKPSASLISTFPLSTPEQSFERTSSFGSRSLSIVPPPTLAHSSSTDKLQPRSGSFGHASLTHFNSTDRLQPRSGSFGQSFVSDQFRFNSSMPRSISQRILDSSSADIYNCTASRISLDGSRVTTLESTLGLPPSGKRGEPTLLFDLGESMKRNSVHASTRSMVSEEGILPCDSFDFSFMSTRPASGSYVEALNTIYFDFEDYVQATWV
jgi:hypothetical protein